MKQVTLIVALALSAQIAHAQSPTARQSGGASAGAPARPTILLVHGGFVDGSGWEGVYNRLRKDGYKVLVVQHSTTSLSGDVAYVRRAMDGTEGRVLLVGHSYGGAVITEAGNDDRVAGLVYIAAFAPDSGESVATLIKNPPPGAPVPPILPPHEGFVMLDRTKFAAAFAGDVEPARAQFMADSQVPWGVDAVDGTVTEPAWKIKPSWYLVATDDRMIPPEAQRTMSKRAGATVIESPGSHAVYVSRPETVAKLIAQAAAAVMAAPMPVSKRSR